MRLAVSNIAWPAEADDIAARALQDHGVSGIEIAPTKYWPNPLEASAESIAACRRCWEDRGLSIVAMQALLYGRADLTIFGDALTRQRTRDYLCGIIDLAAQLGAGPLVFGSPKNRQRGTLSQEAAEEIATEFFREVGRYANSRGVELCLEANPIEYGCDFIVNTAEAIRFVEQVAEDGFGLHLDTGGITLAQDPPETTILNAGDRWRHFHVSEPFLAPIGSGDTDHEAISRGLKKAGYDGWISIEMKQADDGEGWLNNMIRSVEFVQRTYGTGEANRNAA